MVKWFKLRPSGDDVEVSLPFCLHWMGSAERVRPRLMPAWLIPQLIGEEEDVSVYDIADHPDFRFRTTDIVIRIGNTEDGALPKEDEVGILAKFMLWAVPAVPDPATRWLQALRPESFTTPCPRMVGMACIRDRQPGHLQALGFLGPASHSLEESQSAAAESRQVWKWNLS